MPFETNTYSNYSERPVVMADQSLKMLRIAKSKWDQGYHQLIILMFTSHAILRQVHITGVLKIILIINAYLKSAVSHEDAAPGASIAVQTYGDFLNFNPHLHAIVSDGCFLEDSNFSVAPKFMATDLSRAFRYQVLKMPKKSRHQCPGIGAVYPISPGRRR